MINVVQPVPDGSRLFDALQAPDLLGMQTLKLAGFDGAILYPETAAQRHVDWAMEAGLGLMFVGECRHPSGWEPSGILGSADGVRLAGRLNRLVLPKGLTIWCDVEGTGGDAQGCIDYINHWSEVIVTAGHIPGLYVGAWIKLNANELYHALSLSHYWRAGSIEPEVAVRGYCMRQIPPLDRTVHGWKLDVSEANVDHLGGRAKWMIASDGVPDETSNQDPDVV